MSTEAVGYLSKAQCQKPPQAVPSAIIFGKRQITCRCSQAMLQSSATTAATKGDKVGDSQGISTKIIRDIFGPHGYDKAVSFVTMLIHKSLQSVCINFICIFMYTRRYLSVTACED